MAGSFTGSELALQHLTPRPVKGLFGDNYLSIAGNDFNFTKQFLPEVYEKEVERYGNRTLSGFLRMVGAEMPMTSDQVIWSEQNRLHIAYDACSNNGTNEITIPVGGTAIDGTLVQNVVSPGQTVVLLDT